MPLVTPYSYTKCLRIKVLTVTFFLSFTALAPLDFHFLSSPSILRAILLGDTEVRLRWFTTSPNADIWSNSCSDPKRRPDSLPFPVYWKTNIHMRCTCIHKESHIYTPLLWSFVCIGQASCTQVPARIHTNKNTCLHAHANAHRHTRTLSHWWYKQLKRQGWIIASWKTVLHRLWGTFWREYRVLKGLQTLTLPHESLLSEELDGEMD